MYLKLSAAFALRRAVMLVAVVVARELLTTRRVVIRILEMLQQV